MAVNGKALAALGIGTVFVWSGIKGWSVLATIGDLITGAKPTGTVVNPVASLAIPQATAGGQAAAGGPPVTGQGTQPALGLAGIAVEYQGHAYKFGGAPGPNLANPWDCSSFMNAIVAIKGGRAIPGYAPGKYSGNTHGPTTGAWLIWPGMTTVKRADVQPDDIILWLGHMGMAISHDTFISALNPTEKTKIGNIDAGVGRGPILRIGRLK